MRRLLLILILTLSFQTLTKADDIKDFEIEGMSVGDNLLNHLDVLKKTEIQIKEKKLVYYPNSKRLAISNFYGGNFEIYESIQLTLDPNNFKIFRISGKIYNLNKDECTNKQKEIIAELEKQFPNAIKDIDDFTKHPVDKSGKSLANGIYLDFASGDTVSAECYLWSDTFKKEKNYKDHISISIETKESRDFIQNEAY
tara:strand:- start:19 stop:612 length:594 start_codon:yes stop_codon:yes gene_type:complete